MLKAQTHLGGARACGCVKSPLRPSAVPSKPLATRTAILATSQYQQPQYAPSPNAPVGNPVNGGPSRGTSLVPTPNIFSNIESMIQATFNSNQPGHRNDWKEVEGCYVLYPPSGQQPEAVVHFLGAAFVGAAPQISYRLFLEALSIRNVLVIATPYGTNFDHLRIADECQYKFDRCLHALGTDAVSLPVYGIGHSLGSVIHLLISARYRVQRAGNVLISFNNRPATDVIPFLSPLIAPSARMLGPILTQVASSPVRATVESALDALRGLSPSVVRQVAPLVEQLAPMYLDVAQGRQEFTPAPEETKGLIRTYYAVARNLLLRFKSDNIDDTHGLAQLLQGSAAVSELLDLTVRTLPGDHLRPLHQNFVDLPPEVARLANQATVASGEILGRMANVAGQMGANQATAPLTDLSKGVINMAGLFGGQVGGPVTDGMQALADEAAAWMGVGAVVHAGTRALPAASVAAGSPNPGLMANYGAGANGFGGNGSF